MKINCHSCGQENHFDMVANVPDEQVVTITIDREGDFMAAKAVSGVIENTANLLESVADDLGFKACVFIKSIAYEERRISVSFLVARVKQQES